MQLRQHWCVSSLSLCEIHLLPLISDFTLCLKTLIHLNSGTSASSLHCLHQLCPLQVATYFFSKLSIFSTFNCSQLETFSQPCPRGRRDWECPCHPGVDLLQIHEDFDQSLPLELEVLPWRDPSRGLYFFQKSVFFLKPNVQDLSFF